MSASPTPDSQPPRGSNFAKYSGLGIQMLAIIGLGTWLGIWLDGRFGISPWGTVILMLLSVFIAMYQVIRSASSQ
jgi:ATP synthase protein I